MLRSNKKELLDGDNITFADIRQNMQELDFINTWLGGHAITLRGFTSLLQNRKNIIVCEIGCGGGDNLLAVKAWCNRHQVNIELIGIDYNKDCVAVAESRLQAKFIVADYKTVHFKDLQPDIIFSSLFCHHFTEEELLYMLSWMQQARLGFFINDLHRHFLAFYSIKILTGLFSKSYLVKNDAPLSVQRGFTRQDWITLLEQAGINTYSVSWKWAFRWLVIVRPVAEIREQASSCR